MLASVARLAAPPRELSPQLYRNRLSNHFLALGRRCGQPGQQHGRRLPAPRSSTARWMRRRRVGACLAESTQQIHSFRASGVRSFQAARVDASDATAWRKSDGSLCRGPVLLLLCAIPWLRLVLINTRYPCDSRVAVAFWTFSTSNLSHACGAGILAGQVSLPIHDFAACAGGH